MASCTRDFIGIMLQWPLHKVCLQVKELVGAPKDGVLVNGDSGNDIELFAVPHVRGCMVVNAHPELKKWCDAHPSPNLFQVSDLPLLCSASLAMAH